MIAQLFCFISKIIGIYADTVSPYQSRLEFQEIPFGSCSLQDRLGIDSHLMEDDGKLVHKSNVNIPLAVLNDLGSLCHLDGLCTMDACSHYQRVDIGHFIQCLCIHTGYDLHDGFQTMYLITGIDALRGIADFKVHTAFQS